MTTIKPKLWVPGDWSAFFGFGTNILVKLLTLTALLRFVLKMRTPGFGRILPATGLMLCLSTVYYACWLTGLPARPANGVVCALPSAPASHNCDVAIMPTRKTAVGKGLRGGPDLGVCPAVLSYDDRPLRLGRSSVKKITPRAALLGTLAGVSITFISMLRRWKCS